MTLLATLYPAYNGLEFDLEAAATAPKRLVISVEQAVEWASNEVHEGRDPSLVWNMGEWVDTLPGQMNSWHTECNEDGNEEEWILHIEDVPFWLKGTK